MLFKSQNLGVGQPLGPARSATGNHYSSLIHNSQSIRQDFVIVEQPTCNLNDTISTNILVIKVKDYIMIFVQIVSIILLSRIQSLMQIPCC